MLTPFILNLPEEERVGKDFPFREAGSLKSEQEYSPARISHFGNSEVPFPGSPRHKLRGGKVGEEGGESPGSLGGKRFPS